MNLRHFETFVAVAEEQSFSRAADRLHVVQSAVSAGIRALEAELGASLFDRGPRGTQLSDAGKALLPEARLTLQAAEHARDAVRDSAGGISGTVRLGIMQSMRPPAPNVAAILASFRETHPAVDVIVGHGGGSAQMGAQIIDGQLDLAFVSLPPTFAGLDQLRLSRQAVSVACHEDHPLASRAGVELADLAGEAIADLPPLWGTRIVNDQAFAAAGLPYSVAYEINDTATLVEFVRYGLAIALLPQSLIGSGPHVVSVPILHHRPFFDVSIAQPAGRRIGPAAAALLAHITALSPEAAGAVPATP
jgi:DNA-binding transcriptional LysR family regulator